MDKDPRNNGRPIRYDVPPDVEPGIYSNYAIISHTATEFVLDLAATLPGSPLPKVRSRAIMTPSTAKRLLLALQENVANYERLNGLIELNVAKKNVVPFKPSGDA